MTDNEYKELIVYANKLCFNNQQYDGDDLVNDCLLEFLEGGREFNLDEIKRNIYGKIIAQKRAKIVVSKTETTYVCANCHEPKPAAAFYLISVNKESNQKKIYSYCKDCATGRNQKNQKKYYYKNKELLTDVYIRKLLSKKYKKSVLDKRPEIVLIYKKEKIKERFRSKVKNKLAFFDKKIVPQKFGFMP